MYNDSSVNLLILQLSDVSKKSQSPTALSDRIPAFYILFKSLYIVLANKLFLMWPDLWKGVFMQFAKFDDRLVSAIDVNNMVSNN